MCGARTCLSRMTWYEQMSFTNYLKNTTRRGKIKKVVTALSITTHSNIQFLTGLDVNQEIQLLNGVSKTNWTEKIVVATTIDITSSRILTETVEGTCEN